MVGVLVVVVIALAVSAMGLITIHTRPITPERLEVPSIQ
jgi:hypothetical protein